MTERVSFERFSHDLATLYQRFDDPTSLNENYQLFLRSIVPLENTPSRKAKVLGFEGKYNVYIHDFEGSADSADPFEKVVVATTLAFRELFPEIRLESQEKSYLSAHSQENPFALQWNLIGDYVKRSPKTLSDTLIALLTSNPIEGKAPLVGALVDAHVPITEEIAQLALSCDEKSIFWNMLAHSWDNVDAMRILTRALLRNRPNENTIKNLVHFRFDCNTSDFRYALEIDSSYEIIAALLNHGGVKAFTYIYSEKDRGEGWEKHGSYFRREDYYEVRAEKNAGYIPTQDDLEFARVRGYGRDVLELIEGFIGRKKWSYDYRNSKI